MQGWTVEVSWCDQDGFGVSEKKYIALPEDDEKNLVLFYFEHYDEEFNAIEKRIKKALAKNKNIHVRINSLNIQDFVVCVSFSSFTDEAIFNENNRISCVEGIKKLQKTLNQIKQQAKEACRLVAIA